MQGGRAGGADAVTDQFGPEEFRRRAEIIGPCWTACREPLDAAGLRFIVNATRKLSEAQLRSACEWVATHHVRQGQTTLRAVMDSIDAASREAQRAANEDLQAWCVPCVNIDQGRRNEQLRILNWFKKRASEAHWDDSELATIRGALEADSPALADCNRLVRHRLIHFSQNRGMPKDPDLVSMPLGTAGGAA